MLGSREGRRKTRKSFLSVSDSFRVPTVNRTVPLVISLTSGRSSKNSRNSSLFYSHSSLNHLSTILFPPHAPSSPFTDPEGKLELETIILSFFLSSSSSREVITNLGLLKIHLAKSSIAISPLSLPFIAFSILTFVSYQEYNHLL